MAVHAASADLDQSNALLQRPLPTKFSITVTKVIHRRITGFIDTANLTAELAAARRLRTIARPRPVQALARG